MGNAMFGPTERMADPVLGLTEIMGNTGVLSAESGFYDIGEPER